MGVYYFWRCSFMENCPHCKRNPRSNEFVKNLTQRLNKISGQINGVTKMINDNRYCGDVLTQIAAIESALKQVGYLVLKDHMETCVSDDIKNNDFSSLEEALEICKKLA